MQLSERFPHNIKPVHPGVYRTIMFDFDDPNEAVLFEGYSRWDGNFWSNAYSTLADANIAVCVSGAYQNKVWWGIIKEEPKFEPGKVEAKTIAALKRYIKEKPWHSHGLCFWLEEQGNCGAYDLSSVVRDTIGEKYFVGSYVDYEKGYTEKRAEYAKFLIENLKSGKIRFFGQWKIV